MTTTESAARLTGAMPIAQIMVEEVPEDLRATVDADAQERNMNRNDVVNEILARRFRVPFTPSGYTWRAPKGATQWNLRMPIELRDALRREIEVKAADGLKLAQSGLIIATLQAHYDLPVDSPRRRSRRAQLDPEVVREARARHETGESFRSLSRRYGIKRETLAKAIRAAA